MTIDDIRESFTEAQAEVGRGPIFPSIAAEEIRAQLEDRYDFRDKIPLNVLTADVEQMLRAWQVQVTHPRYFGLFNPNVTLASVIADTLVATYNPQLANWRTSPVGNEIERHTLRWMSAKFGMPEESIANFTSGGTEANLTAIVAALTRAFPEYGERGIGTLKSAPTMYLTRESHNGYQKIAHITGLGRNAVRIVSTDKQLKMDVGNLERQIAEDRKTGRHPFLVVGTAGTTGAGVIDPLEEIGRFCRQAGLWLHVDAAWGGAAILSPTLKHYLAGIEAADSITCDAHKWLSVPMGCGMFFCRHPESVKQAFRTDTTYMANKQSGPVVDPLSTSIQWSRRFIGLKLFMALAEHGESGYVDMIEHQAAMGRVLKELLIASGWRIVNNTPLPLVCFTRDGLNVMRFLDIMREQQIAWMSSVQIGDDLAVRACVTNFKTTEAEIQRVVEQMNHIASEACECESVY